VANFEAICALCAGLHFLLGCAAAVLMLGALVEMGWRAAGEVVISLCVVGFIYEISERLERKVKRTLAREVKKAGPDEPASANEDGGEGA
jgi:hypothetical protein